MSDVWFVTDGSWGFQVDWLVGRDARRSAVAEPKMVDVEGWRCAAASTACVEFHPVLG